MLNDRLSDNVIEAVGFIRVNVKANNETLHKNLLYTEEKQNSESDKILYTFRAN